MSEMNRREFVAATAVAGVCLCVLGEAGDEALAAPPAAGAAGLDIGTPADYPTDGFYDKFAKSQKVMVIRSGDTLIAANAACTHKGCVLAVKDGALRCPCHKSSFDNNGTPTGGPAKAALFRYAVKLDDSGHIRVNKSKQFGEKQWEDPAASIKVS